MAARERNYRVAFRYANVTLVPDMYVFSPAARSMSKPNGALSDQIAFGSSFPFRAMAQSIDDHAGSAFATMCWRNSSPIQPGYSTYRIASSPKIYAKYLRLLARIGASKTHGRGLPIDVHHCVTRTLER
jgi:hypothetical protein